MNGRSVLPACLACLLVLGGCANEPKLLRHYQKLEATAATPSAIELSAFLANPKASEDVPLVDGLAERGQAELIRALATKASSNKELMSLLHEPTKPSPKSCSSTDKTSLSRRLVLTVLGDLSKPADRIDKLDITLTLLDGTRRAEFASWDRFDSVYGTFNIGSAKFTQSDKLTFGRKNTDTSNLANSAGSVVKVFDFGYESSNALEETAAYALRRLTVGGALNGMSARLIQEGAPNINLFGSSAATLTLKVSTAKDPLPVYVFTLEEDKKPALLANVKFERCLDRYPTSSAAIKAKVSGYAHLREVLSGDGTVSEGDDEVRLRKVPLTDSEVELAKPDDLEVQRFGLVHCPTSVELAQCARVHIEHNGTQRGGADQLMLQTIEAAGDLRNWLIDQSKGKTVDAIGGLPVGLLGPEAGTSKSPQRLTGLTPETLKELRVARLGGNSP